MAKQNHRVIDADGHILEPADMWQRYMEPKFRDRAPTVKTDPDGKDRFYIEDMVLGGRTGIASLGGLGYTGDVMQYPLRYTEGKPGGFDPKIRLKDMDAEGVDAAFLYPSLGLFVGGVKDPQFSAALCRAYNRWLADYCSADPQRLFGIAMLPMFSVEAAIEEMRFARKQLGFRGGFMRPNPYHGRMVHHRVYDPFFAEAQDLEFSIGFHEGAESGMPVVAIDRYEDKPGVKHIISHSMEMMLAALSVIMCGVCERYPKVHFGFLEAGGGWMAGWLDRMDRHFNHRYVPDPDVRIAPSDYFKRQCWIAFEPVERSLPHLAEFLGPEKILWATDYPHVDGYIGAPDMIKAMPGMSEQIKLRILSEGAKGYYRLK